MHILYFCIGKLPLQWSLSLESSKTGVDMDAVYLSSTNSAPNFRQHIYDLTKWLNYEAEKDCIDARIKCAWLE